MRLRVRDDDLRFTGEREFRRADLVLRWNKPATATLELPANQAESLVRGCGVVLDNAGEIILSGQVVERRRDDTPDDDVVELTVRSDLALLEGRLAYPDHEEDADGDQPKRMDRSGPAGEVLAEMVERHAGTDALPYRRVDGLTVADASGVGETVRARRRFPVVAEEVERLGRKGKVVCDLKQVAGQQELEFTAADQADRTRSVVFSRSRGTLVDVESETTMPGATVAIVAGPGEGADRLIVEREDADAVAEFGRIEAWVDARNDADEDDPEDDQVDDLEGVGDDVLDEMAAEERIALEVVEAESSRWRADWDVGDLVTVEIDGERLSKTIEEVEVEVLAGDGPDGGPAVIARPVLGRGSPRRRLRVLERVGEVERRQDRRDRD